jgi:hypothetical protein
MRKNPSINSRLVNQRPHNNLSKHMTSAHGDFFYFSSEDHQHNERYGANNKIIEEKKIDGSQYENISIGSIGSFGKKN